MQYDTQTLWRKLDQSQSKALLGTSSIAHSFSEWESFEWKRGSSLDCWFFFLIRSAALVSHSSLLLGRCCGDRNIIRCNLSRWTRERAVFALSFDRNLDLAPMSTIRAIRRTPRIAPSVAVSPPQRAIGPALRPRRHFACVVSQLTATMSLSTLI